MIHRHEDGARLSEYVDHEDLDAVLRESSLEAIAEAWHCYCTRSADDYDDPDWWAIEFWMGLAFQREEIARSGLLALVDAASDDALAYVGAGPLEVFVCEDESRLCWLEEQAARSARFRKVLSIVYCWGLYDDSVCERLERAARQPMPRPRWPFRGSLPRA